MKKVRCAIYTRKSSEEGLEQDFNSLHAQREACAAYVMSQASEGWHLLPDEYDDGGISGGTLERPGLQRLLADIEAGKIDIVVVYKVDRLTRSLLDFSRLVESFDRAEVSFVSVTQSFNTTTSMGRLTLNMLLSFAQFEREVTAERIRDKIAASKARGMWMGGIPPLGYEPDGRSLAIVAEHADVVRDIYRRYQDTRNVRSVAEGLARDGVTTPRRTAATGKRIGGALFSRGQLYAILRNPIYAGDIAHRGRVYPGNHPAIIAREEWDAVQQQLADNRQGVQRSREANASLLAGIVADPHGNPLQAVHTSKGDRRYRYYVSRPDGPDRHAPGETVLRIPATELEQLVRHDIAALLADPFALLERTGLPTTRATIDQLEAKGRALAAKLQRGGRDLVCQIVSRVTIHSDRVVLLYSARGIAEALGMDVPTECNACFEQVLDVSLRRSGMALRIIRGNGTRAVPHESDRALVRLVCQARQWWAELAKGEVDIAYLARREGVTGSWMTRVMRLAFLAPEIVEAILAGKLRAGADAKALLAPGAIAQDWNEQRAAILPQEGAGLFSRPAPA